MTHKFIPRHTHNQHRRAEEAIFSLANKCAVYTLTLEGQLKEQHEIDTEARITKECYIHGLKADLYIAYYRSMIN